MGHNFYTIDLGCRRFPGIHDRDIRAQEGIHRFLIGDTSPHRDTLVVMVCDWPLQTAE